MKQLFLLALLSGALTGFAQKAAKPESYAKTISADDLKKHLYIIASKEMGGRETGTEGERKAAAYIENEFKRIGLQPGNGSSYHQFYNLYQDSLLDATVEVNGQKFQLDRDFNVSVGQNIEATMRFSEAVFISPDATDSAKNANLAGKLVIVPRSGNTQYLNNKGVAAILVISIDFPKAAPANRKGGQSVNTFRRSVTPQQFSISENVARAIMKDNYETLKNAKGVQTIPTQVLLGIRKTTLPIQTSNVLGVLPGTDLKDEYLFITAHHDHIGKRGDSVINYGADDDGSGTVSVIEMAEAFAQAKKEGRGPRRSIVFMTVSGEEKGLLGSEYYAANAIYPMDKTTADLNIDMIGRSDPKRTQGDSTNYVYVVGDDKLSSDLRIISEQVNKKYTKLELDYKFNDPNDPMMIYYRSDHYNFAKNGVPIIFYFNGTHADYHRPGDTPDKINYPLMAKRARLVFHTAWEMANRDTMLKRDLPLPALRR
jgi:Zn-dependent M28 family amino/carboxypeptidase